MVQCYSIVFILFYKTLSDLLMSVDSMIQQVHFLLKKEVQKRNNNRGKIQHDFRQMLRSLRVQRRTILVSSGMSSAHQDELIP